jgi:hypothetical protein
MRYARLRFVVAFGVAAVAAGVTLSAGSQTGFVVAVSLAGLAWAGMLLDEVRGATAASAAFGTTARGFTRGQVARGIALVVADPWPRADLRRRANRRAAHLDRLPLPHLSGIGLP